jgi:hypothetical protein
MIEGVTVTPLRQIFDERGKVMHMLREDSPRFMSWLDIGTQRYDVIASVRNKSSGGRRCREVHA